MAADLSHFLNVDAKKHKYEKTVKGNVPTMGRTAQKGSIATEQM